MVGEWLVNGWQLLGEWLANGWKMVGQWLVNGWQIFGRLLANGWPMVGQWFANGWPMVGQWLADCWPMAGQCLANGWPTVEGIVAKHFWFLTWAFLSRFKSRKFYSDCQINHARSTKNGSSAKAPMHTKSSIAVFPPV